MHCIGLTSVNSPEWHRAPKWLRANLEWLGTSGVAVAGFVWRDEIITKFASKSWELGAYLSAVFNWSSLQGAFLFGVYAFFLSRSEPFIQAIAPSPAFKLLRQYVLRTLYLSMVLSAMVLPMLVAPASMKVGEVGFSFGHVWLATVLLTYTVLCFLKVVRVFGKIERRS